MFHRRKAYSYYHRSGKLVYVPECWVWRSPSSNNNQSSKNRASTCPMCGAKIETIRNKRGGWAHFETGLSAYGTLHSCFTVGRGMSERRDDEIADLFE